MFCPFIKGNCVSNCIFYNDNKTCDFVRIIKNIEFNTNTDQTESWSIDHKLGDILDKLDCINKKFEQPDD